MKIVVLDGYTLSPGDISWDGLKALGDCEIYDRTPSDQVVKRAGDADIVITNKTVLSSGIIEQLSELKYIGVLATGYNVVDVDAAKKRGIPVSNIPTYGTRSVAQMAFAHILNLTQHVAQHAEGVSEGKWSENPDFCYWDHPMIELDGKTLGIIGAGRIGLATAMMGLAFGMKVLAHDVNVPADLPKGIEMTGLETLLKESDVVSLHCPLTPETDQLMNRERLGMMKPTAFLVNTSRGPLIDEVALAEALSDGVIAGAGLDVLSTEPPEKNHPLYALDNCYITPHIAWATKAARSRLMNMAVENIQSFLAKKVQNQVNR